jgi:signal transduction histidine kinase
MSRDARPAEEPAALRQGELAASEHAALRRIAALVAEGAPTGELLGAVVREILDVLGLSRAWLFRYEPGPAVSVLAALNYPPFPVGSTWPLDGTSVAATIRDTGRPTRLDDYSGLDGTVARRVREAGVRSACGAPIFVDGRIWGGIAVSPQDDRLLPADTTERLAAFTELVAVVISSAAIHDRLATLADHQTSLRRVATLVAEEAPAAELFAAVTVEATRVLGVPAVVLSRYEGGTDLVVVASRNARRFTVGSRWALDEPGVAAQVYATGRPARVDDYSALPGRMAEGARDSGIGSVVGVPIMVEGRIWGVGCVGTRGTKALPAGIEDRLRDFTDLVGIAIANAESRQRPRRLAEEQAALRRVATLVAEGAAPSAVFSAVAKEVAQILDVAAATVVRFESNETSVVVASHRDAGFPVGSRWPLDGSSLHAMVYQSGLPARLDDHEDLPGPVAAALRASGVRSWVAVPITVDGRVWGMIAVGLRPARATLPAHAGMLSSRLVLSAASTHEIEQRLAAFTELVATAISKAQVHDDLRSLADEQAALRRVATLVAQGAAPSAVFDSVAAETAALLGADGVVLCRYEEGDEVTRVAHRGPAAHELPPARGIRREADLAKQLGVRAAVGAPVVVEGRSWGLIISYWRGTDPPPINVEARIAQFAELLDTAIANADSRDQLTASRVRLLSEADAARRRVVRDLHDGAQQRLVQAIVALQLAQGAVRSGDPELESLLAETLDQVKQGNEELRELAHGVLPSALMNGGLRAGVGAVVKRLDLPVEVAVPAQRFPAEIEASAYFIVAEALTNVAKHARATRAEIRAAVIDGMLRIEVRDDGVGGADASGHGLVGLGDRATTLGGRLEIESPRGGGTVVTATLPLPASSAPAADSSSAHALASPQPLP